MRRHGTSSAAADTDADAAAYSREDLGAAGLAACSRGLPRLAVLALNNHVKLSDADLAPLFGSSPGDGEDGATVFFAPAPLEVLELCACARITSEMCAVLLEALPLVERSRRTGAGA